MPRQTTIRGIDEPLREPLRLESNTVLRDSVITIHPTEFACDPQRQPIGVIQLEGAHNVLVENCRIVGLPHPEWVRLRGEEKWWVWPLRGITLNDCRNVTVRNCHIQGWPAEGLFTQDITGLRILRCSFRDCWCGFSFDWPRLRPNADILVEDVWVDTTRAVDQGTLPIGESVVSPGRLVGGNYAAWGGCDGVTVRRVRCLGEGKGIKWGNCSNVLLEDVSTPQLWIGGYVAPPRPGWGDQYNGPHESRNMLVQDCVIGESTWGFGRETSADPTTLFCAYDTADEAIVQRCTLLAPRPGPLYNAGVPYVPWDRHGTVFAHTRFRLLLRDCRIIDQFPMLRPPEISVSQDEAGGTGGAVIRQENVTLDRFEPSWHQG